MTWTGLLNSLLGLSAQSFHTVSKDALGLIVCGSLCGQQETGVEFPLLLQVTPSTQHAHGFTF